MNEMKKNSLTFYKSILPILMMSVVLFIIVSTMSVNTLDASNSRIINPLGQWINHHKALFLLFHSLIAAAIYFALGMKVDFLAKRDELSPGMRKQLKRACGYLIGVVALIDVIFFYLMV